jgi:hypothetical protein
MADDFSKDFDFQPQDFMDTPEQQTKEQTLARQKDVKMKYMVDRYKGTKLASMTRPEDGNLEGAEPLASGRRPLFQDVGNGVGTCESESKCAATKTGESPSDRNDSYYSNSCVRPISPFFLFTIRSQSQ